MLQGLFCSLHKRQAVLVDVSLRPDSNTSRLVLQQARPGLTLPLLSIQYGEGRIS